MYLPEAYKVTDLSRINELIEHNSFGDLVTYNNGMICSNKVPFLHDKNKSVLFGHFGRNNPQLIDIEKSDEVLVIFSGAHSYISPQWYSSKNRVPTWNFQTIQVRGKAKLVGDEKLLEILDKLSDFHESKLSEQWSMSQLDSHLIVKLLKVIVGFEIEIGEVLFKEKMSQNRSIEDQQSVIKALSLLGGNASEEVAKIMSRNLKSK